MDIFDKEKRSWCMSRIRGKDTTPEMKVRLYLHHRGFRYRKCDRRYPGSPDIVLPRYRTAIFVNGCFWHGHTPCSLFRMPKSNVEFWEKKIGRNRERDRENREALTAMGWRIVTVWECQLGKKDFQETMDRVEKEIRGEC